MKPNRTMNADPLTLDRARSLRLDVLEPLTHVSEGNKEFRKLALDVQYLIEYLEVYAFNSLSAEEVTDLYALNVRVTKDIDDNYQRIMEAYDAYLTENPDENPDKPKPMKPTDQNNEVQCTAKTAVIRLSEPRTLDLLIEHFSDTGYMNTQSSDIIIDTFWLDEDPSPLLEIVGIDPAIIATNDYLVFYT